MSSTGADESADLPLALFIMGPTATGKTDLAIQLQDLLPGRIISVDSAMIYRGMDIGTAKPAPAELARAPHRLIDMLDPSERYSVADFCRDARREMAASVAEGRVPLLTGGTMMYFKALKDGFAEMPVADSVVRQTLHDRAAQEGWGSLFRELESVDPVAAVGMHPNNHQRLVRALEVYKLTGRPLSAHWASSGRWEQDEVTSGPQGLPYRLLEVALVPEDRHVLHNRIEARFRMMLNRGLIEEVECLRSRGDLDLSMPSMRAVGYRQVWEYLDGNFGQAELVPRGAAATRQLAKRQVTWLRKWRQAHRLDPYSPNLYQSVLKLVESPTTLNGRM